MIDTNKHIAIISDSAADISRQEEKEWGITMVPFYIDMGHHSFVDDENLDVEALLKAMDETANLSPVKTACPSPGAYLEAMKQAEADHIFILTISRKLSASWESAMAAKRGFLESFPQKKVEVIDSMSAAAGSGLVLQTLAEYVREGLDFDVVTEKIRKFAEGMRTFFVLDSLENLIKNGRLPLLKGALAKMLGIKVILGSNGQGEIEAFEKHRGLKKTLQRMAETVVSLAEKPEDQTLYITYAGDPANALQLKKLVQERMTWKEIVMHHSRGLSTSYTQRNGVVVAFR